MECRRQRSAFAAWWTLVLLFAAGAWAAEPVTEPVAERTRLICALPADFAPTCFSDHGKATGFAVEIIDEIARRCGLRIDYVFGRPWDELQDMLLDRRADLIAALIVTEERKTRFVFTGAMETVTLNYLVRAEQPTLAGPLPGMRVGVLGRSSGDEIVSLRTDLVIVRFGSQQQLLIELLAGRIDMVIAAKSNLRKLADDTGLVDRIRFIEPAVRETKRAIALRPEDAALRDRLDAALADFVGTPRYNALYQKWWGTPRSWWTTTRVVLAMSALLVAVAAGLLGWRFNSLRAANRALRRSEAVLLQSQRVALVGHYIFHVASGRWSSSATLDAIFGIDTGYAHTIDSWQALIHPEDRARMAACLRDEILGQHLPFDREYRIIRRRDGAERWVHVLGSLESDAGGAPRMFGTIQDITERKRAETVVHEANLRLECMFQNARDAIIIADPETGTLLDVNRQAEALLGRPRHELFGLHQSQLHPPELRDAVGVAFSNHAAGASSFVETQVLHRDGSWIPVEINSSVIALPGGRRLLMGMFRDIRERVRLQEQLHQSEKMTAIGQLAGGVAHDFNNQLAGISGYAELLANGIDDPRQRRWAEAILGATQRAAELTRQLLAFARKGQSRRSPTDLHQAIGEVVELLSRSIDRRIVIVRRLADGPCLTLGDPGQLHHALLNLALNARDAMPDGGELSFATRSVALAADHGGFGNAAGRFIEIAVGDTGCGMDVKTLRHIFEPFFTTKAPGKGTGLGLAAVYGVVRNHGGAITVASTPGHGSTFTIHLPLLAEAPGTASSAPEAPPGPAPANRRVLVVDDETVVRGITCEMLRSLGYTAVACAAADEALALCRHADPFDLVVLDLVMPRIGGRDAFIALRAAHPGLRILLASGHSLNGEVQAILDLGACGFIQKPFRIANLAQAVGAALATETRPA